MGIVVGLIIVGFMAFAIPSIGWIVGIALWGVAVTRLTRRRSGRAPQDRSQPLAAPPRTFPTTNTSADRTRRLPSQAVDLRHGIPRSSIPQPHQAQLHDVGNKASGRPIRLSGHGRQKVVGEQYHPDGLRAAIAGRTVPPPGNWDRALPVLAALIREPNNRHDPYAVRVDVQTMRGFATVGYIPAEVAVDYAPGLDKLASRGLYGEVAGRIVAGQAHPQVYLHLSGPPVAPFANVLPAGAEELEAYRQCSVTNEARQQDSLTPFAPVAGATVAWFTLQRCEVPTGKYAGEATLGVFLDGRPVGNLTAQQGQRYGRLILPYLDEGKLVACEGAIHRDPKGVLQAMLFLPRLDKDV